MPTCPWPAATTFTASAYNFGPIASLTWQYLGEDGFTETGAGTIAKDRSRHTMRCAAWTEPASRASFDSKIGVITPELRVAGPPMAPPDQGIDEARLSRAAIELPARCPATPTMPPSSTPG
jgi:hypothetical protein